MIAILLLFVIALYVLGVGMYRFVAFNDFGPDGSSPVPENSFDGEEVKRQSLWWPLIAVSLISFRLKSGQWKE